MDWIATTLAGVGLGVALFGCVRLRMYLGPLLKARYGMHLHRIYWGVTILVMVVIANMALRGLRAWLHVAGPPQHPVLLEAWFAVLALGVGFALISRRMNR